MENAASQSSEVGIVFTVRRHYHLLDETINLIEYSTGTV